MSVISSSMKDTNTPFQKTNNFGDFHNGSIHTQRIIDHDSKNSPFKHNNGNPDSLVVS